MGLGLKMGGTREQAGAGGNSSREGEGRKAGGKFRNKVKNAGERRGRMLLGIKRSSIAEEFDMSFDTSRGGRSSRLELKRRENYFMVVANQKRKPKKKKSADGCCFFVCEH